MIESILVIDFFYKAMVLFAKESVSIYFCPLNNVTC